MQVPYSKRTANFGTDTEPDNQMRDYLKNDSGLFEASIAFFILNARENEVSSPVILGANTYVAGKYQKQKNAELSFGYIFLKYVHEKWGKAEIRAQTCKYGGKPLN